MLIHKCRVGETIEVCDDIRIRVLRVRGTQVELVIDAPKRQPMGRDLARSSGRRGPRPRPDWRSRRMAW